MTRIRAKSWMAGEIPGPGLPWHGNFTNSYMNTRMWGITKDGQGCHHLPPTPQPWSTVISVGFRAPEHHAREQRNYPCPPGLQPYGLTSKNMGKPEGTTNRHPDPSSTSTHTSHMNVEE